MKRILNVETDTVSEVELTIEEQAEFDSAQAEEAAGADARAAAQVRKDRNYKLSTTDWTASTDVTMTAEIKTYRQALRDLPTHANFPDLAEADWPDSP